jgi:hypothetical protein
VLEVGSKEKSLLGDLNRELTPVREELVCVKEVKVEVICDAVGSHGVIAESE